MLEGKLWHASRQRMHKIHQWRPRCSRVGELVQWDTSEHAWFVVHDDDPAASFFARGKTVIQHVESVLHTGRFKNPSGREKVNSRVSAAAAVETRPSHVGVYDHVERVPVAHLDLGAGWIAPAHRIVRTPRRVCDSVRVAASPLVEQRVRGGDFCRLKKSERLR